MPTPLRAMISPRDVSFSEAVSLFSRDLSGRNMAGSTIAAYTTDVHQFANWLAETTIVVDRPTKVTKAAAGGNARNAASLMLFPQTGIRVSELVSLTLPDVDLVERILRLRC